jgi:hypothetical protein
VRRGSLSDMLRLNRPTHDAPLSFLAEPRILEEWNESEKGRDKASDLGIIRVHQLIESCLEIQKARVVPKNRLDGSVLARRIVFAWPEEPVA